MRTRVTRRPIVAALLLAAAVGGLAGCRTSPTVAAYVGDSEITVAELESAVDRRLEDPDVAAFAEGREDEFTRRVLGLLVQEELYADVAERYGLRISDDEVRARIEQLLGGQDPDTVFQRLASEGIGREDVIENVRQQLVRQRVAEEEGLVEGLSEEALRSRYQEVRESLARVDLGYITVPDQATADVVLRQLTADPASYPQLAARYAGTYTLPEVKTHAPNQVPSPLAEAVAGAEAGTGFTLPIEQTGGVVVGFVAGISYPSFEEVRDDLESEAAGSADEAATEVVDRIREDLDVAVNPRYGVLEDGVIEPGDGGVVDILDDEGSEPAPDAAPGN